MPGARVRQGRLLRHLSSTATTTRAAPSPHAFCALEARRYTRSCQRAGHPSGATAYAPLGGPGAAASMPRPSARGKYNLPKIVRSRQTGGRYRRRGQSPSTTTYRHHGLYPKPASTQGVLTTRDESTRFSTRTTLGLTRYIRSRTAYGWNAIKGARRAVEPHHERRGAATRPRSHQALADEKRSGGRRRRDLAPYDPERGEPMPDLPAGLTLLSRSSRTPRRRARAASW